MAFSDVTLTSVAIIWFVASFLAALFIRGFFRFPR